MADNKLNLPKKSGGEKKVKKEGPPTTPVSSGTDTKKQTRLCIESKKEGDFSKWYTEVLTKGDFMAYYSVSGCYYILPNAFYIWKSIQRFLGDLFETSGVVDMYAPMFVTKALLETEKAHIADFAPEVAWVTMAGSKSMAEPVAIRPTSETILYPLYATLIQSHRDLPLRWNQWSNVVRWEFKNPQPFLRTREFLWQEGHSVWEGRSEAEAEVMEILGYYVRVYEELLAVPVVQGRKTDAEKFAGAEWTATVEAFISQSGRGIQGATSHCLGTNFSTMFDIGIEGADGGERRLVWQNSWGITTRTIGVMVMVHGDNKGLQVPPRVARIQVVVVPCGLTAKLASEEKSKVLERCSALGKSLTAAGIRCHVDLRDNYTPGWKFNSWEQAGVPLRVEIGPKDVAQEQITVVRRDNGSREALSASGQGIGPLLEMVQSDMLASARERLEGGIEGADTWEEFLRVLECKKLVLALFCGTPSCEAEVKRLSVKEETEGEVGEALMGAKSLCVPFEQPQGRSLEGATCICPGCKTAPMAFTLFGRSY